MKMKKYALLVIILLFYLLRAYSQSISVKSFRPLVGDMTTTSAEGKRIDQNGEVAALIKVVTNETGFVFEGGTLGIVGSQQRVSEIWVWVPRASRKITIMHQQLGQLRDYRFPVEIEADRTYEMVLTTAKIETIIKEEVRMQYLAFQITPPNATLEVNETIWEVSSEGSAQEYVNFGTYTYRVQAPNYYPDAGRVTVDDPNNTKIVIVDLKPNFGWIEVAGTGNLHDANVYIDNALIGRAPCKSDALKSGQHSVRIAKKMYEMYSEVVTVQDNKTVTLAPSLKGDFAEVTLKVNADAEIWVNNEKYGTRTWTGPLGSGSYKIECKQANHEPSLITQEITPNMGGQIITLPEPTPIYGSLLVESTPSFSRLFIDGKDMGTTPKSINELLIGQHQIKLTKEGYSDYTETVTIAKDERKQVKATLSSGKDVQFTCNVTNASLEIDGNKMGSAAGTYHLTYGEHSVKATANNYRDYTATLTVTETYNKHNITMQSISKDQETIVIIETSMGTIKVKLYNDTPKHRDNFIKLVNEGWYNGSPFHRVIKDFMIQGGQNKDGRLDPGYTIPAEFKSNHFHKKGALAAARQGDQVNPKKASSGSQFYIVQGKVYDDKTLDMFESRLGKVFSARQRQVYKTVGGSPHLDGDYTVFGEVTEGLDIVDKIAAVKTGRMEVPIEPVSVISITIGN